VIRPVPHRHFVFALPKVLRPAFRYRRRLLPKLALCAWKALSSFLHEDSGGDALPAAIVSIRKAKEKSRERRVPAVFLEWDALEISGLGKRFDTVIDCGLFHVFSDEERPLYVEGLSSILPTGGTYRMLCFSEMEPGDWGPRRVTPNEIRDAFARGWKITSIREARFETNLGPEGCRAWLSSITRE
jgi:hypothetical protein